MDWTAFEVLVDVDNQNEWKECFDVHGVKLPTGLYFGASATTGDLADNHDIISMKLYEIDVPETQKGQRDEEEKDRTNIAPFASGAESHRDHVEDVQGSFSPRAKKIFGWLFWLAAIGCVGLGIGLYIYHKQQENARKRFY